MVGSKVGRSVGLGVTGAGVIDCDVVGLAVVGTGTGGMVIGMGIIGAGVDTGPGVTAGVTTGGMVIGIGMTGAGVVAIIGLGVGSGVVPPTTGGSVGGGPFTVSNIIPKLTSLFSPSAKSRHSVLIVSGSMALSTPGSTPVHVSVNIYQLGTIGMLI